jgi:hypothetical protein
MLADIAKDQGITLGLECNPQGFACARLPDTLCALDPFHVETGVPKITRHEANSFLYLSLIISYQGLISLSKSICEEEAH